MKFDKGLIAGSSTLLVLTLLESGDMYGYQMIEELSRRSNDAFQFQEGTLYPILHGLEKGKYLSGYQQQAPSGRMRKYYRLTRKGREPAFRVRCWLNTGIKQAEIAEANTASKNTLGIRLAVLKALAAIPVP